MGELGLNEYHQDQLVQFLRFSRYQRAQRLRAVDGCFEETRRSRLADTTFTRDEVAQLLANLQQVLRAELESELINAAHTGLLLLRQLCGQAEKYHLKLAADLSELENRELLDAVQQFEDEQFDLAKRANKPTLSVLRRLEPLDGAAALFQGELERLGGENERLRSDARQAEGVVKGAQAERAALLQQLAAAETAQLTQPTGARTDDAASAKAAECVDELRKKIADIEARMSGESAASAEKEKQFEEGLSVANQRLLEVKSQLEMAEKELDKKFSQTAAYKNMKQMLGRKNQQMKDLRARLNTYEPADATDDADEV